MSRPAASSKFIVVHRRKIVMYEGIGMDHLLGSRKRANDIRLPSEHPVSLQHQHWTKTLPPCHETVLHSLQDHLLESLLLWEIAF